ncbi:hypothetical protein F1880_002041 [Penicillium rolfsii]|nr:hypothetical protein F1880_002041 [Penicillium rolfsii]
MSASHIRPRLNQPEVAHAYRHLYRQGLKAIGYATPSRYVLRTTLRTSFRASPPSEFNPSKIANTLRFLKRATDMTGMEHKILKNLLLSRYWEMPQIAKESRTSVIPSHLVSVKVEKTLLTCDLVYEALDLATQSTDYGRAPMTNST